MAILKVTSTAKPKSASVKTATPALENAVTTVKNSSRTTTFAQKSGVGILSGGVPRGTKAPASQTGKTLIQPFGPKQPQVNTLPVARNRVPAATRTTSAPATVQPSAPTISKESQLQQDANSMGLTGTERQAFIENKSGIATKTNPKINLVSPVNKAVSSTEELRAKKAANQADATTLAQNVGALSDSFNADANLSASDKIMQDILNAKAFTDTPEGKQMYDNLVNMQNQLASGQLTPSEEKKIKEQADATQAQYDALVADAQEQKAKGMASALVEAGQRGGLMNSQFSGLAATTQTAGRNFYGAGGELDRIQSDYDSQIFSLRAKGIQAVADAKSAAEEAIRTGKQDDLDNAMSLFDKAQNAYNETFQLNLDKQSAITAHNEQVMELQKYNRDTASTTLSALAASGKTVDEIPDWYFEDMDKQSGYKEGTSRALFELAVKENTRQDATQAIEQAQALNNLLTSIPVGEEITVGDTTYRSIAKGDTSVYTEDDGNGNVTVYSVNKDTGEVKTLKTFQGISSVDGDIITNNGVTAFVSKNGQVKVIYDANQPNGGIATGGLIEAFPQDSYSTFTDENGIPRTQCGEWVNDVTGLGVGDSLESKIAKTDSSITAENAQVGDVIVTSEGGSTGHVAIINSISYDENGNPIYTVSESNYKKDKNGIGIITHDRTISGNSRLIKGYARPGFVDPAYNFGTDTSVLANLFGQDESTVDSYVSDYLSGNIQASSIPSEIRSQVISSADEMKDTYSSAPEVLAMQNITGLSQDVRKQYNGAIISALASGNTEQARTLIASAVYDAANSTTQEKLDGRSETLDALTTIKDALQSYYDKGGSTGIFRGTEEDIMKAVGRISDPTLRSIATRIQSAIINYRRSVSGAAFTESEAAQYESLFPNIKNGAELNLNTIDTLMSTFNNATERFYRDRIGESNYNAIFSGSQDSENSDVQDLVDYGNYISSKLSGRKKSDGTELTYQEIVQLAQAAQNALNNGYSQEDIFDSINSYLGY